MPVLQTVDHAPVTAFRQRVTRHARMHGYYLIDVVSIATMRSDGRTQEEILDAAFEHFDDQTWPPLDRRPSDVSWADHEVAAAQAEDVTLRALIGGAPVGHTRNTVAPDVARGLWNEFQGFFLPQRRYYVGMGLGDPAYAYLHGAAILDARRAGILWVVEGD